MEGPSSPPSFPWELVDKSLHVHLSDNQLKKRQAAENEFARFGWNRADDAEWLLHAESGWLCNPFERVLFHAASNMLLPVGRCNFSGKELEKGYKQGKQDAHERADNSSNQDLSDANSPGRQTEKLQGEDAEEANEGIEAHGSDSDEESDFMLDLEDVLVAGTAQKQASRSSL